MKKPYEKSKTFRDKLYEGVEPEQRSKVDALLTASVRGTDRIEGIQRSRNSYEVDNPRDLPRVPQKER